MKLVDLKTAVEAAPSFRSSFTWTLAANLVYAAAQWGMLAAVAKLSTTVAVGQFALGLSIAAPVFMFTNLQLRGVQATDARSEHNFADYFMLRCMGVVGGLALIVGIVIVGSYDKAVSIVILLVAGGAAVEQLSDVIAGLLQKCERLDQVARAQMLRGVASITMFVLVLFTSHRLVAAVCASSASSAIVVLTYDFRLAGRLVGGEGFRRWNLAKLKQLFVLSLPLGLVTGLVALNANIPRYVVQRYLGPTQLGIFVSLVYLVTAGNPIANALGQSASARLARMYAAGNLAGFNHVLKKLMLFGACIGIAGVPAALLFGKPVLSLIYRPEYAEQARLLSILAGVAGISAVGSFLGYGMTAARQFRSQLPIIAAATFVAFTGAVLLVPTHGLYGAAFALLASTMTWVLASGAVLAVTERKARARTCGAEWSSILVESNSEIALLKVRERD